MFTPISEIMGGSDWGDIQLVKKLIAHLLVIKDTKVVIPNNDFRAC